MHSKARRKKEKDLEPKAIKEMKRKKKIEENIQETKQKAGKRFKKILLLIILIIILYLGISIGISTHTWKVLAQDMILNEKDRKSVV